MKNNSEIEPLSKEQLFELIEIYSKNWLALDGVWFQSIESKYGMDEAIFHDEEAWRRFSIIEATRLKQFLGLPEQAGLSGLAKALRLRFYAHINKDELVQEGNTLCYRVLTCRVQSARARHGMEFHPCKSVGLIEYTGFASAIDSRIHCQCLSCYPDQTVPGCCCVWLFTLQE